MWEEGWRYLPFELLTDPCARTFARAAIDAFDSGRDVLDVLGDEEDPDGSLQAFAAAALMAPIKVVGRESSREDAVHDLVLFIWRRELKNERDALVERLGSGNAGRAEEDRVRQLTMCLRSLRTWRDGEAVMEVEKSERLARRPSPQPQP